MNKTGWYLTPELKEIKDEIIDLLMGTKRKGIKEFIKYIEKECHYFMRYENQPAMSEHTISLLDLFDMIVCDNDILIESISHSSIVIVSLLYVFETIEIESHGLELLDIEKNIIDIVCDNNDPIINAFVDLLVHCDLIIDIYEKVEKLEKNGDKD